MIISFRPYVLSKTDLIQPTPAIQNLPEWYKKKSPFIEGDKEKHFPDGTKNVTIKRCNPFGDALAAGYYIFLENDVQVTQDSGSPNFTWTRGGDEMVGGHPISQFSEDVIPEGYSKAGFKFKNFWSIQTPKGYSVLLTHPMNRTELPFITLSGVVETDSYFQAVNFPFLLRKDFEGIIEAGTPIAQVIPFKREAWSKNILDFEKDFFEKEQTKFRRTLSRYYKRFHWKRKEYK